MAEPKKVAEEPISKPSKEEEHVKAEDQKKRKEGVEMAQSGTPQRMVMSNPNDFIPKAIFFLTPTQDKNDWIDCFSLKACAVYFAIFREHADDKSLDAAGNVLKAIAQNCNTLIKGSPKGDATVVSTDSGAEIETIIKTKTKDLDPEIMITIDAVYLVLGLLQDIYEGARGVGDDTAGRQKLDKYCMSRHGNHVLSDIAMLGNQLPLDRVLNVAQNVEQAVTKLSDQLSDQLKASLRIGKDKPESFRDYTLHFPFRKDSLHEVVSLFSWYYSPFYAGRKKYQLISKADLSENKTLLECLHHCLVQSGGTATSNKSLSTTHVWPVPTAKDLRRAGVKFDSSAERPVAVNFARPSLKLPALFFDSKLETVAMNLMALESSRSTRPVTRYFQLLNELVDDVRDVRVLSKFGVVRAWKREEEVVNFVKRVDAFASYPSMFPAMDLVMENVKNFHDGRMNRFLGRYRPDNSWVPYVAVATVIFTAIVATKRRG